MSKSKILVKLGQLKIEAEMRLRAMGKI